MTDTIAMPRVSPGVPAGGQFAASARTEASIILTESPGGHLTATTPLAALVPPDGRLTIGETYLGNDRPFHAVVVADDTNSTGFHITALTSANLVDALATEACRQQGADPDDVEEWVAAEKAAEAWLRAHSPDVAAWSKEAYGATMEPDSALQSQHFSTHLRLGPDATLGAAVNAATTTRIGEVDAALRSGEFARRMLDEAPRPH